MKFLAAVALCAVLLSGCSSLASMGKSRAQLVAEDADVCRSYGFKRGTDAYASCMLEMDQRRIDDNNRRRDRVGRALIDMRAASQPRRSTTCTSTGNSFGTGGYRYGSATTTCY
jgi:hypothetical protein